MSMETDVIAMSAAQLEDDPDWIANRSALLSRLRRVEGQVRGIQAMIEREEPCEKVAQQMSAARKALDRSFYNMLSCVIERELSCAHLSNADAKKRLNYATELLSKYG